MNKYTGWIITLSIGICILLLAMHGLIFPVESMYGIILGGAISATGITGIIDTKKELIYVSK